MYNKNIEWLTHKKKENFTNIDTNNLFVILFSECNFAGDSIELYPGKYEVSKIGINKINSIKINKNLKVTLYDNIFQGKSLDILKTEPCLSDYNFDDITSSFIVEFIPNPKYQYIVRGCANEVNTIKCPTGFFLKEGIISYGKWDNDKCGFQPNTKIKNKKSLFEIYGNDFTNKKEFEVKINDELFDEEPIKGINKSYEIEYNCKNNTTTNTTI
jgi:hypothetical protein